MMDQPLIPKMPVSRGTLLSMATNSAFRWSPIGEVTESLTLSSRSMDEFYPELRVNLERPPETVDCVGRTFDCVGSPQYSRSPTGRNAYNANGCTTKQDKVKVYVRMRPFSDSEKVCPLKQVLCLIGETIVVRDLDQKLTGISKEPPHKAEAIEFKVDYMQDDSYLQVHSAVHKEESQKRMYGALGVPCIESALDGYNTTILAYGQTGSGKTYTMMGDNTKAGRGLIPRLANDLMARINEESRNGVLYTVQVSHLEIYQEKIRDLLAEDEIDEEAKPTSIPQTSLDSSGMNSSEKVRSPGSNPEMKFRTSGQNLEEKVIHSYAGGVAENSYTSSFLNKAALQRQLEASQRHSKIKSDAEKSPREKSHYSSAHDGVTNKVRSPKTKPAFDTVFNKQKIHKHYRTFPTVLEEAPPVRKQNFLKIREHPITGPFVEGLLWKDVCTWYDMETLMKQGCTSRTTAATDMNEQSSRSHAVFSIRLTKKLGPDLFGVHPSSASYINLVDLAGSEKLPKLCSGAVTGQRTQEESRCINRSLSQLNEVILSLSKSSFVSYRNSVLTWLLKESLGGNSRTFMVANISPTEKDLRESINTLRYATTASRIPPPVALDQDPRNKLIKTLKEEICTLRTLLSSFTSMKENAPSDQHPSLQGFKVPCLDFGLQVEHNCSDNDGSRRKELHVLLDKGSQTENHARDVGQQTTSRNGSGDAGFQMALKDGGALDMGNPTVLQDSGRVDFGHQTLILNVCACDSAHQAFAKDFGILDAGLQVALRELGIVTLSQQSTVSNCGFEDVCFHSTPQDYGSVCLGHQPPLKDCAAVDVGYQVGNHRNVRNQFRVQSFGGVHSLHQATLRDEGGIDDRIWVTLQNQDDANAGNEIASPDREDVDATNQVNIYNCGGIYGGNQITPRNLGPMDAVIQIALQDWEKVDAGNQITLRNWGDVHAESQISSTDWSPVDVGLQTPCRDFGGIDVGNQITEMDWGLTDAAQQTNPADCRSKDASHQTRFQDHGVHKATDCTVTQLDGSHQIDCRESGASDAGFQITLQKPLTTDTGFQVSPVDFGTSDNGEQSLRDFWTSNSGNQVTLDDQGGHRHAHNTLKDYNVFDDELQADRTGLKIFEFEQQVSCIEFRDIDVAHHVNLNDDNQVIVPKYQFPFKNDGCVKARHPTHPSVLGSTNYSPQMTLGHSCAVGSGHEIVPRPLRPVDAGNEVDGTNFEPIGSDGGHGIEARDLSMTDIGLSPLTSDVQLQTSQADFGTSDAGNQVIITSEIGRHNVMSRGCGSADLDFLAWSNIGGDHRSGTDSFHIIPQNRWAEDVGQQAAGKKLEKADQQISLYPSTAHDNSSIMTSEESDTVNPSIRYWRSTIAVKVGHPNVLANLGAIDVSYEAGLRVGLVEERKEQFERKNLSAVQRGQHKTLLEHPAISVVQQASLRGVGAASIGHKISSKVREGEDITSKSDRKIITADVGHRPQLQDGGRPVDVHLQGNLKNLRVLYAGLQTSCDETGVKDSQLGRTDNAGVEYGCETEIKDYRSVAVRHQSTSTDLESLEVDHRSLDGYKAVEARKRFRCRVCGATQDNSIVVVSDTVPIQEVAADSGLQTRWIDFCATASELQSPTTGGWGVSSDVNRISPKVLDGVDERSQVDWEELHPCHEHHQACWNHFGGNDLKCEDAGQDTSIHNWHHHHEITLSDHSYLATESDADTLNTNEETSWNNPLGGRHQNPQVHGSHLRGVEFLQDLKLKQVRARNVGGLLQRAHCGAVDTGVQAFPRGCATVQVKQQPGGGALEGINHNLEERFEAVSAKTRILKKRDGDPIGGIPQAQTIQEGRSGACDSSEQTQQRSYRFSMPAEHLDVHGDCESGQCPDEKLGRKEDSICLSWLRDFTGRKKRSGNVPAEEAFHLCSLWTLAKLRSRMEWYSIHSERNCWKYRSSLASKCLGLVSQPPHFSNAEVATQTASCPKDSTNHKTDISNAIQHICLLWVFIILRIAAPDKGSPRERKRQASKGLPFLASAAPRKIRILSCVSDSAIDERRVVSRRNYRPSRLRHLRYSGVEPLTFKNTTPFFIQTSGDCSLLRTRVERSPRTSGSRSYKIMCGIPSRRVVHFLKEGVNRLGSNRGDHIFVNGLSEDHTEFIYMPANRCMQKKGYVVARLVAPGAMAFLNGLPMLEHKELSTGDVLVLRDLRYWSSVCTLHFFDLVKIS